MSYSVIFSNTCLCVCLFFYLTEKYYVKFKCCISVSNLYKCINKKINKKIKKKFFKCLFTVQPTSLFCQLFSLVLLVPGLHSCGTENDMGK